MVGMRERGLALIKSAAGAVARRGGGVTVGASDLTTEAPRGSLVQTGGGSGFMRNLYGSSFLRSFLPNLRDAGDAVRQAWPLATARAEDLIRNSGWIAGGIRSSCGQVIGEGLRLSPQPDTTVIKFDGLTTDDGEPIDADGWIRFVKRRWQAHANDPNEFDARGLQTFAQMTISAYKVWFATGEIVALLPMREPDAFTTTRTKVQLIPPHRLSQRTDPLNRIMQGIRFDAQMRAAAYLFKFKGSDGIERELSILARDAAGRPQVIHVFEAVPTQVRGITPLVPVIEVAKKYDQLSGATLTAAMIQTIFAATVESEMPTMDVLAGLAGDDTQGTTGQFMDYVSAQVGWSATNGVDLGNDNEARLAHLLPGEKLKFNRSEHPNTTYEAFAKFLLREAAKGCGVTFSQMTGDYSGVTYTGVRMEGTDQWQITLDRRNNIVARFCQPCYEAWLEEEIETGRIKFPGGIDGFLANRAAACRARWLGPPKPAADDVKQATVHEKYRSMGIMSDENIANDLGMEIDDVYANRQREKKLREKYGLDDNGPSPLIAIAELQGEARAAAAPDGEDPEDPEERNAA